MIEQDPRERTDLLREINHRVKNNLQVIVSLINLQSKRAGDRRTLDALEATQNRVRAIAALHERRYASVDLATIHIGPYLEHLIGELSQIYNGQGRIQVRVQAADLALDIGRAIPVAIVSNELVVNAFHHAFPGGRSGSISTRLSYAGENAPEGRAELEVADDGVGLPEGIDVQTADSMSFELLRILSSQLRAELTVTTNATGTSFRLNFPL